MKAVVYHGPGDIRLDDVAEPKIEAPTDAVVRLTANAICGTDLHLVRGTVGPMKKGTILGHEGVGVVEEVGDGVRNLTAGDRVVICSTISCGACAPCRRGLTSGCLRANPNGPEAGTSFFGGPEGSGPIQGLQAEKARIPWAATIAVRLPDEVPDEQAIVLSDILPTAWFGCDLAKVREGSVVAVFGCGPVGQLAIACALHLGAGRVFAIDQLPDRLARAKKMGAEAIDFSKEDPVEVLKELTIGLGVDCAIDAVGVDANFPDGGPAARSLAGEKKRFATEVDEVAPKASPKHGNWEPGSAPSIVPQWGVEVVGKGGTLAIIGVYPDSVKTFPIGEAMGKNLTIRAGDCNHRRYMPKLINLVRSRELDLSELLTQREPLGSAIEAYQAFDKRTADWVKVELLPDLH